MILQSPIQHITKGFPAFSRQQCTWTDKLTKEIHLVKLQKKKKGNANKLLTEHVNLHQLLKKIHDAGNLMQTQVTTQGDTLRNGIALENESDTMNFPVQHKN